jgi:hypothetical protein
VIFPAYRHCADFDPQKPIETAKICFEKLNARVRSLQSSDPELYDLLMRTLAGPDVAGGFSISVGSADLDCDEANDGGFESCSVTLPVEVRSHAEAPDNRRADIDVHCDVSISYETEGRGSHWDSAEPTGNFSLRPGRRESLDIVADFDFLVGDPATRVRLDQADCDIDGID